MGFLSRRPRETRVLSLQGLVIAVLIVVVA
jgi:hypothetical protein